MYSTSQNIWWRHKNWICDSYVSQTSLTLMFGVQLQSKILRKKFQWIAVYLPRTPNKIYFLCELCELHRYIFVNEIFGGDGADCVASSDGMFRRMV